MNTATMVVEGHQVTVEVGNPTITVDVSGLPGATGPQGPPGPAGPAIGDLLTTKGDLAGRDATTAVRVPVGSDGQVLTADAAAAAGVRWGNAPRVTHPNTDDVLVQVWDAGKSRWQVSHYDSGWRDITGLLVNGWTGGTGIRLRRSGTMCYLQFTATPNGSAATSDVMISAFPSGFRAPLYGHFWPNILPAGTSVMEMHLDGASLRARTTVPVSGMGRTGTTWSTQDAIPTTLPGTLVSAAPAYAFPGSLT